MGVSKRILLVDDDEAFRYATKAHLTLTGLDVVARAGSMAALEALDGERRFDLLVADIRMPPGEPHGLALARMARTRHPELPVVFVTAYSDLNPEDVAETGPLLRKPFELDTLALAIREELGRLGKRQPV